MMTLYDLGIEVERIRAAIDSIEVKGVQNAKLISYAFDKCNGLIEAINEAAAVQQNPPENQNGEQEAQEEVEIDGEQDSGTITAD